MAIKKQYQSDLEAIMAKRHDNGGDYWATPDRRLIKGSPFTTLDCAYILSELGMDRSEPVLKETTDLILSSWREDGRFKLSPKGAIYPCHTINAARTLCHLGYASDRGSREALIIFWKFSTVMAAGVAISSASGEARKQSFQIRDQRWRF